jgi:hypothetical protein
MFDHAMGANDAPSMFNLVTVFFTGKVDKVIHLWCQDLHLNVLQILFKHLRDKRYSSGDLVDVFFSLQLSSSSF